MQKAATEINNKSQLASLAAPFLIEFASVCLPDDIIEINKKYNPQEESKEEATLKQQLS
jgi:hypothetical protein